MRVALVGAGGLARETLRLLADLNAAPSKEAFEFVGCITTEKAKHPGRESSELIVGDFNWLTLNRSRLEAIVIAVGTPRSKLKIAHEIETTVPELQHISLVHPTAVTDERSLTIGPGCIVEAGAILTANVQLDRNVYIGYGCTIGHEASIGAGAQINPGANVAGGVIVGEAALIGSGAQVLEYRSIGRSAVVGAGAVVTTDIPDDVTVVGIPARPV